MQSKANYRSCRISRVATSDSVDWNWRWTADFQLCPGELSTDQSVSTVNIDLTKSSASRVMMEFFFEWKSCSDLSEYQKTDFVYYHDRKLIGLQSRSAIFGKRSSCRFAPLRRGHVEPLRGLRVDNGFVFRHSGPSCLPGPAQYAAVLPKGTGSLQWKYFLAIVLTPVLKLDTFYNKPFDDISTTFESSKMILNWFMLLCWM